MPLKFVASLFLFIINEEINHIKHYFAVAIHPKVCVSLPPIIARPPKRVFSITCIQNFANGGMHVR